MIVVGMDFSPNAEVALAWALTHEPDRVRVVYVSQPVSSLVMRTPEVRGRLQAETVRLREVVAAVRDSVDTDTTIEEWVQPGDPVEVLLNAAADADLLVVGRRGVGGVQALLAGDVSRALARRARVPVIVVPALAPPRETIRRVVAGVDGSPTSAAALRWAYGQATRTGAELAVVYACPVLYLPRPLGIGSDPPPLELSDGEAIVTRMLESLADVVGHHVDADVHVEFGNPAQVLDGFVGPGDLLVVGVRGHSAVVGLLMGSTAEQCLSTSPCPVAVIPACDRSRTEQTRREGGHDDATAPVPAPRVEAVSAVDIAAAGGADGRGRRDKPHVGWLHPTHL